MCKKLRKTIEKHASLKTIIILFIITQAVYGFMWFVTIPEVMNYSEGINLFDLEPIGYSSTYAHNLIDTLGEEGRNAYLFHQIPIDMLYPLLYATTYSLLLTFLFKRAFNPKSKMHKFTLLPLLSGLFDYLENIGVVLMLTLYPSFHPAIATITSIFSILKNFSIVFFFIFIAIGVIALIKKKRKEKKSR